ncbi:MAG: DUF2490 domain-containing protein [Hyphomonas sp.]
MRHVFLAMTALGCATAPVAAAENQIWTDLGVRTKPFSSDRIELSLDSGLRFQPDGDLDTIEIRPGIGYKLDNRFKVSGGYLYASTRRSGPDRVEHRLWQQLNYDIAQLGAGKLSGRSLFEQRRREGADDTGWRLRQQFSYNRALEGTPFTLALSTDIFVELLDTDWGARSGFSENRAKATLQWQSGRNTTWQAGYLNQYLEREGRPDDSHHHLYLAVSARL